MRIRGPYPLLVLLLTAVACGADAPILLQGDGFTVAVDGDSIGICEADGQLVLEVGGFDLKRGLARTTGGRAALAADGSCRIVYDLDADGCTAGARVSLAGTRVSIRYELTAPPGTNLGSAMYRRRTGAGGRADAVVKEGLWTRHAAGGVPYEVRDGVFRRHPGRTRDVWEVIGGNPMWADAAAQHLSWSGSGGEGQSSALVDLLVLPAGLAPSQAAAINAGRPLALALSTGQPFNLWDEGQTPEVELLVAETAGRDQAGVEARLAVRDFDGRELPGLERRLAFAPGAAQRLRLALPGAAPGIYFVEATIGGGDFQAFARTSLAVMRPFAFPHRQQSIFGLSATFAVPSAEAVIDLCRRIGVRWLRNGDAHQAERGFGGIANRHSSELHDRGGRWQGMDQAGRDAELQRLLRECDARGNPWWELGNEWDLTKGEDRARTYVEGWLRPISRLRAAAGSRVRMMTQGFANGFNGEQNLRLLRDAGGWDLVDAVSYHLGRGNLTPDAVEGNVWNFLGSLRQLKRTVAAFGAKPIHITEAYAATPPNNWWNDTLRRAPENIVLSYALALSEGVEAMYFYQLHDGVWHDVGGMDHADSEYSYGLLERDGTAKPSLLAYQAVACALDGASFRRWLDLPDPLQRGLGFAGPDGTVTVLWDRSDGYVQAQRQEHYAAPEPWVEHWTTRRPIRLPAHGAKVEVVDCIGRVRQVAVRDGQVDLELSGSPLIVRGLAWDAP